MRQTLNGMRKRGSEDRGFTMIELLVVVVIIGVLVAIAVPVYLNYRKGAANKSAASDVRGAITAVEQFYTDNGNKYPDDAKSASVGASVTLGTATEIQQTISVSPGNDLRYTNNTTDAGVTGYWICARNEDGGQTYLYNSTAGGSVKKTNSDLDACETNGA